MSDWGGAYDEQVRLEARLLRQQREGCIASGASRRVYDGTTTYEVGRMSDAQIDAVARRRAEVSINRAINLAAEHESRKRMRAGEAL